MTPQQIQDRAQKAAEEIMELGQLDQKLALATYHGNGEWTVTDVSESDLSAIIARHFEDETVNQRLVRTLKNYLIHPSIDGHEVRQGLRRELTELLNTAETQPSLEAELAEALDALFNNADAPAFVMKKAQLVLAKYDAQKGSR